MGPIEKNSSGGRAFNPTERKPTQGGEKKETGGVKKERKTKKNNGKVKK